MIFEISDHYVAYYRVHTPKARAGEKRTRDLGWSIERMFHVYKISYNSSYDWLGGFEPNDHHDMHCLIGMGLNKCVRNKDRLMKRLLYMHNFFDDLGERKLTYYYKEAII